MIEFWACATLIPLALVACPEVAPFTLLLQTWIRWFMFDTPQLIPPALHSVTILSIIWESLDVYVPSIDNEIPINVQSVMLLFNTKVRSPLRLIAVVVE